LAPDIVINAAAYTNVDKAETQVSLAYSVNADFVEQLATYCARENRKLIHLSTDYVFDGKKNTPYLETDAPNPQGVYAQSKWQGEQAIILKNPSYIILRVSWVFGKQGGNFVKTILNLASSRETLKIVSDQWGRPTAARDIARVVFEIVQKIGQPNFKDWGIYHYGGADITNWFHFAELFLNVAKERGYPSQPIRLEGITSKEYVTAVQRPQYSVLAIEKIKQNLEIEVHSSYGYVSELVDEIVVG
jgi:dTDP-4-dehydrorhamnose reductase